MSVHSHSTTGHSPAATPEFPRHVVTAVLVAHDGARWLPQALAGLLGQERPVQDWVAADTGSADDSARLLGEALGEDRVLNLARRTAFGTAVDEAVRATTPLTPEDLPYLKRPSGWDPVARTWRDDSYDLPELPHGEPVHWLWLLHDDCAPEPDALTELLRVADGSPEAAVVGPKLRGWYDRKQLLETGVTIARSGRRWTGLDRREQDQGQHDQVRPVLAVSTAGMLVRREVFEALGGFDRALPLMRDDVDLCWRAHAAGHTVLIAPDAVLRHAEAAARERRPIDCAGRSARRSVSPHRVDKAAAVHTLLVNTPAPALPYVLLRLLLGTVLRTLGYLVGKAPGQAVDEVAGAVRTFLRPGRVLAARRARGRSTVPAKELRPLFPPPGATLRATVEQLAGYLGADRDSDAAGAGRHGGAVESGPGDEDADFLEIEQFARVKRIARRPAPVLFALLLLVSLIACRSLLTGGSLAGGALLPAPGGASALWSRYLGEWQAVGTGGTSAAPPYLAVLAALAAFFLGSTGLTLTVLLVCSVPLAGLTAYFASRPLVESRLLRAWAAVAYAFLPAVTGALAGGRLGTAVLAVLLPLMARAAVTAHGLAGDPARGGRRAVWTYALLLTLATAFTPVVWPLAVLLGAAALIRGRADLRTQGLRFLAVVLTPLIALAPWSLELLTSPSALLREAGLPQDGGSAGALDLLGLSPGGPGTTGGPLLAGVLLAALAALLRTDRRTAILTAWTAALTGLLAAVLLDHDGWAGPGTLLYGAGLLAAAVLGADGARHRVAARSFGWRQPLAALIALAAAAGPVLAASAWMLRGADEPLQRRDPIQVPAFVAEMSGSRDQPRTLVLAGKGPAELSYALVRGSGGRLGDAEAAAARGEDPRLDRVVANLVAGSGADQTRQLGDYAVRYVLLQDGAPQQMSRVLNATPGLTRLSKLDGISLWEVKGQVARAVIRSGEPGDDPVPVAAGPVEAHTTLPDGPAGRVLRIADTAAEGWRATLDGKPLVKKTLDGWAQGFELPARGGRLDLTYEDSLTSSLWHWLQGTAAVLLLVMALPGRRRELDDDLPEEETALPGQADGEGRRARRLRAEAEAGTRPEAQADPYAVPEDAYPGVPAQPDHGRWDSPEYAAAPVTDPYGQAPGGQGPGHAPGTGHPYAPRPGHDPAPGHTPGTAYDPQAPYGTPPGPDPSYDPDPSYGPGPSYGYESRAGYDSPGGYEQQDGYDQRSGYAPQPGYEPRSGHDPQGGYDPQGHDHGTGHGHDHPRPDGSSHQ